MSLKMRIMVRAVQTRLNNGEELEAVLASYPRLTNEERELIRNHVLT